MDLAQAKTAQYLPIEAVARKMLGKEKVPDTYDLADAAREGLWEALCKSETKIDSLMQPYQPELKQKTDRLPHGFRLNKKGHVEYCQKIKAKDSDTIEEKWIWLCDYLVVTSLIRDKESENWKKRLKLTVRDAVTKEIVLSSSLMDKGIFLKEELDRYGLNFNTQATHQLLDYIHQSRPLARLWSTNKVGWFNQQYVLPDKTYGPPSQEQILLQLMGKYPLYEQKGTLEGWKQTIGFYSSNNSMVQIGLLAALAAPLLTPLGRDNFGIHLVGNSSCGKSTALRAACSVYGSEFRSWRTTDNAAESMGMMANDNLLVLDDMGQASASTVSQMVYMLGNGSGKARANKLGNAQTISQFKNITLSSGEVGVESKLGEGVGKFKYQAGQAIRMIEIPADGGTGNGVFTQLHDIEGGAELAEKFKTWTQQYGGMLGEAWLGYLTHNLDLVKPLIEQYEQQMSEFFCLKEADGQVQRVQKNFSLMSAVGELAINQGLLPWEEGSARKACAFLLKSWITMRGGTGSHETMDFVKRAKMWIETNSSARFETIYAEHDIIPELKTIFNKAGFREQLKDGKIWGYYVFPDVFQKEVIGQGNKNEFLNALVKEGMLIKDGAQFAKTKRLPGILPKRVYWINFPAEA